MKQFDLKRTIQKIIDIETVYSIKPQIDETAPIGIIDFQKWEWPQGVGLFTLWQYYKMTGDESVRKIVVDWFDARFREGLPSKNVNTMCPLLTMTYLYEQTKDEKYVPYLHEWATAAMNELPRTKEGGIQHIVTGMENKGQLWDDTLYMTVLFMSKYGVLFKKQDFIDEGIYQFLLHIKYLTDKKTGLWFHGWSFERNDNFANALWARGNSWITAGIPDYLEIVEGYLSRSEYRAIINAFQNQIEALIKYQDSKSGLWHTLIDDPTSYLETSASANFLYGIMKGVRIGILDKKYLAYVEKGIEGLFEYISDEGVVGGVSYGTGMGHDLQFYKDIVICPMPYGQTLTALALMEYLELKK